MKQRSVMSPELGSRPICQIARPTSWRYSADFSLGPLQLDAISSTASVVSEHRAKIS